MNIFYAPPSQISAEAAACSIVLKGQEAQHATQSLRYQRGDAITVVDGIGGWYEGTVAAISKTQIRIRAEKKRQQNQERLILAMGIIKKKDRLEFAVEKSVELGVREIVLFRGEHSVKQNVREDRLQTIIQSAMKQSLRAWLPQLHLVPSLPLVLEQFNTIGWVMAHQDGSERMDQCIPPTQWPGILIGPEGGFSDAEVQHATEAGASCIKLGTHRLRAETAAITAVSQFHYSESWSTD